MERRAVLSVSGSLLFFFVTVLVGCGSGLSSTSSGSANNGGGSTTTGSGGGTGQSAPVGFLFALENPNAPSTVEAFSVSNAGVLTSLGTPVPAENNGSQIVADPHGKFLVVGNTPGCCASTAGSIQLLSYTITSSGTLTAAGQVDLPNAAADTLNGLLLDPSGADLYASSEQVQIEGTISSFAIDSTSGKMSTLAPDLTNTIMPGEMSIHPNGRYLYAAIMLRHHYPDVGGFDLFLRDPATGALTDTHQWYTGPAHGSDFYGDVAIALGGQYLIAVAPDTQKLTVWSINSGTGALSIASSTNGNFKGLTVDHSGNFAIATLADGTVSSYKVNADGSLTQAGTAMAAAGVNNVVSDATGKFLYAENSNANQIFGFTFDPGTGALASIQGSPFKTSGTPIRMATVGH